MRKANKAELKRIFQKKEESRRTTFNLTKNVHEFISYLAKSLKMRKKEIFNRLLQIIDVLDLNKSNIAKFINKRRSKTTIRRTYVIDTEVLRKFEQISRELDCKRDILIEALAMGLVELIDSEKKRRTPVIEETIKRMDDLWSEVARLERDLRKIFDEDNKIFEYFSTIDYGFDMGLQFLREEENTH
jgi:hypothetical protein